MIEISDDLNYTIYKIFCRGWVPTIWGGTPLPGRGRKNALKGWYKALEDLVWLTQLGLNILLPLVLCLAGCWWAVDRWNWPEWLFLPAVLLGLAAGAQNFWVFAKERLDRTKNETSKRVGFNHHQ